MFLFETLRCVTTRSTHCPGLLYLPRAVPHWSQAPAVSLVGGYRCVGISGVIPRFSGTQVALCVRSWSVRGFCFCFIKGSCVCLKLSEYWGRNDGVQRWFVSFGAGWNMWSALESTWIFSLILKLILLSLHFVLPHIFCPLFSLNKRGGLFAWWRLDG